MGYVHRGGTKDFGDKPTDYGNRLAEEFERRTNKNRKEEREELPEFNSDLRCENCRKIIKGDFWDCKRCGKLLCDDCRFPEDHKCIPIKHKEIKDKKPRKKHARHNLNHYWRKYKSYLFLLIIISLIIVGYNYRIQLLDVVKPYYDKYFGEEEKEDVEEIVDKSRKEVVVGVLNQLINSNFSCFDLDMDKRPKICMEICREVEGVYITSKCTGEEKVYCKCRVEVKEYVSEKVEEIEKIKEYPHDESGFLERLKERSKALLEDLNEDTSDFYEEYVKTQPERKEECKEAFDYLNSIRGEYGRGRLSWDDRIYDLAIFRTKDMYEKNYFDHVTPDGKCVKDFKSDYGLNEYTIAENCGASSWNNDPNDMHYALTINVHEQIDSWMTSRGHKYNLLYEDHIKGAIGCYYGVCVFLGANTDPYGLGAGDCTIGVEGLAFWETISEQEGEI